MTGKVTVWISKAAHYELKRMAAKEATTMQELADEMITDGIVRREGK